MAKNKLSVLLIKKNTPADMIIKQQDGIQLEHIAGCSFYYKCSFVCAPKWAGKFFLGRLQCESQLRSSSTAGVLLVERHYAEETRTFAVCFGYGRSLLSPSCVEERFGLITTLNTINPQELRSVDISRLDTNALKNRIQSSRLAGMSDFEFDVEKSLLRQATGLSNDDDMGKTVSGSDSFNLSVEVDIDSIGEMLDLCYNKYTSEVYRYAFSWVDHIMPIKKGDILNTLDGLLIEKLQSEQADAIWMSVPEIIDWEDVAVLKFENNGEEHEDILMEDFRIEVLARNEVDKSYLLHNFVYAYNANGDQKYKWPYYRCLYAEVENEGKLFMLNAGSWYQVDNNYKETIVNTYNSVPLSTIAVIDYNHTDEAAYNVALASLCPDYCLMDRKLISTGIQGNNVEFCDVYDKNGKMIHIKKYGGSQLIGHLFNQGLVSARLLFDINFLNELNDALPHGWKIQSNPFNPRLFEVVYGIISKYRDSRPHIPFFSMVVFHDVFQTLRSFGYTVSLKAIYNAKG